VNIFKAHIESDIFWIRFGRDLLIFTEDEMPEKDFGRLVPIYSFPKDVLQTELYIIVQKERLFQRQNSDVPVIYDGGRYLLVRLEPSLIEKIEEKKERGYSFKPLERGRSCLEDQNLEDYRREPDPAIRALVDQLSRDRVKEVLESLASFYTRFWTSSLYRRAASQMKDRLNNLGFTARLASFESGRGSNVIADKRGLGSGNRKLVLVTAHLDSIGTADGDIVAAPGADDNASGCAGLIEIASIFQNHRNEHDLRLILFGGEEIGSVGSKDYVANLSSNDRRRISAVINMDMIGFVNSSSQRVLIEGDHISQHVIDGLLESAATYSNLTTIQTSLCSGESDHVSFIDRNMPAVLTNEGTDFPPRIDPRIHSPNDTINTIDYDLALKILQMNVGYIAKELG
jgi:hypothetical protein